MAKEWLYKKQRGHKDIPIGGLIEEAGSSIHFKTGDWRSLRPVWVEKKCIHCMICVIDCPDDCIPTKGDAKNIKRLETNLDFCKGCGICSQVCPTKCISMKEGAGFIKK